MLKLIKRHLYKIIDDIDTGNSNLTEQETIDLLNALQEITTKDERLSKYAACQYLNISRANFDNKVREGILPKGVHHIGFKELSWSKKDLDNYIKLNQAKYDNSKKNCNTNI